VLAAEFDSEWETALKRAIRPQELAWIRYIAFSRPAPAKHVTPISAAQRQITFVIVCFRGLDPVIVLWIGGDAG
jgi:hypothetical protein